LCSHPLLCENIQNSLIPVFFEAPCIYICSDDLISLERERVGTRVGGLETVGSVLKFPKIRVGFPLYPWCCESQWSQLLAETYLNTCWSQLPMSLSTGFMDDARGKVGAVSY
jgi:hypothetical protein